MHPAGTYCLSHLFSAALAELAAVGDFLLYLGKAKSDPLSASTMRLAAHNASPTSGMCRSLLDVFMFCSYLLNTALTGSLMMSGNAGKNLTAGTAEAQGSRIVKDEWDNKGGREYWNKIKNDPPLVPHSRALVETVLEQ